MLVSDLILDFLVGKGVRNVFLLTGGAISFIIDRFHFRSDIDYVCVAHEQAAAMAADATSRLNHDSIGVALVTSGPGATNLLTGVGCSWFDSIPTLLITGQVNTYESRGDLPVRQIGFQEMDIVDMVGPITKFAVQVTSAEDVLYLLGKAYHEAKSGRPGPVLIDIPMDIQRQEVDITKIKHFEPPSLREIYLRNCAKDLDQCLELLGRARRPALLAGGGVRNSGAAEELLQVAKKFQLPVGLSTNGIDSFPHDHPNFAGFIGVYGNRGANFTLTNSDLLIAVGSRLDNRQTGVDASRFAPEAKKIVVDIDPAELNVRVKADVAVHSDVRIFLQSLLQARKQIQPDGREEWLAQILSWRRKYTMLANQHDFGEGNIDPYVFLTALSDQLAPDDVIVLDTGQNMLWSMQTIAPRQRMRMWTAGGMSPMGYSFPAAIGSAIDRPEGRTVCIIGDGGMQINIQELETARRYDLPITVFVLNNKSLGLIRQFQDDYLDSRHEASRSLRDYHRPDFPNIAAGYGIPASEISGIPELHKKIELALHENGPHLCNVSLSPRTDVLCKAVLGRPIEDQHPFLPREELFENLFIRFDKKSYTD